MTVTRRIRRRGELAISRQTIAQGRPDVSAATCMLVCAFSCSSCTRDRGCQPAPGLSCALCSEGWRFLTTRAHHARRECGGVFSYRSLRGATRRSNPALLCGQAGLLRCARNDGSPTCPSPMKVELTSLSAVIPRIRGERRWSREACAALTCAVYCEERGDEAILRQVPGLEPGPFRIVIAAAGSRHGT